MAGLVPAIHTLPARPHLWMAATGAAMTTEGDSPQTEHLSSPEDRLVDAFAVRVAGGEAGIGGLQGVQILFGAGLGLLQGGRLVGRVHHDDALGRLLELPGGALAGLAFGLAQMLPGSGAAGEILAEDRKSTRLN